MSEHASAQRQAPKAVRWSRTVLATYTKEVRCLIRDHHTLIYSVLVPVFLYPALAWGAIQVATYARAVQDREISTVRVAGGGPLRGLREHLRERSKLRVVEDEGTDDGREESGDGREESRAPFSTPGAGGPVNAAGAVSEATLREAREDLAAARVDAWLVQVFGGTGPRQADSLEVLIVFNSARDASRRARERLEVAIEAFRRERLVTAALDLGEDEDFVTPLSVTENDIASREEFSKYIASLVLPLLLLVTTALGALYPALDVTVGERERGCLETTLLSPVGRGSIVVGKYLAVVSFAMIAFLFNFTSMGFTLFHQSSLLELEAFDIGWTTGAVIVGAALLLSAFLSAMMMLLAFQARTFKEGQSYVMPVYLLAVLPTIAVASPEASLSAVRAWIPIVNIALLFRGALQGGLPAGLAAMALGAAALYALIVLALGAWYLQRREVVADTPARRLPFWPRRPVST